MIDSEHALVDASRFRLRLIASSRGRAGQGRDRLIPVAKEGQCVDVRVTSARAMLRDVPGITPAASVADARHHDNSKQRDCA